MDKLTSGKYNFDSALLIESAIDSEKKTVKAILSEETKVLRYSWENGYYDLILEHSDKAIDFSRKEIMPVLLQHSTYDLPMGIWEDVRLENGKIKATARFDSEDEKAMEIFGKIERGIMKSFSIGINVEEMELVEAKNENGRQTYKATKWSLQECSVVTIPAIPNAKVGFSNQSEENQKENNKNEKDLCYNSDVTNSKKEKKKMTKEELKASHPDLYAQIFSDGENQEKNRVLAHIEMSKTTSATDYAMECIEKGEGFNPLVQAKYLGFAMNKNDANARNDENIPAVETPKSNEDTEDKKRDEAFEAAFNLKV